MHAYFCVCLRFAQLCCKVFYLIVLPIVRRQRFRVCSFFLFNCIFASLLFTVSDIYFFTFDVFYSVLRFVFVLWIHFYFGTIAHRLAKLLS